MKLLKYLKNVLYQRKKLILETYYGFYYRCRGVVSISECQNIDSLLVDGGYSANGYADLNRELLNETNLEMKPFWYVSLPNGRILTDLSRNLAMFDGSNYLVEDVTFSYVQNKNGIFYHGGAKENFFYSAKRIQKPRYIDGVVFSLLTGGGRNFNIYHWFLDSISRLSAIEHQIDRIEYFLVPEYVHEYQIRSLEFLGIKKDRVISSLDNKHVIAKELICTSHPRTATFSVREGIVNFLRDKFRVFNDNKISKDKLYPTSFYISRKDAPRRKVQNEGTLIDALEKLEIATIEISNYTFNEIVHLFRRASLVISTHGASLTNILFCAAGTTVIECSTRNTFLPYYSELAKSLNLEYYSFFSEVEDNIEFVTRYDIQNVQELDVDYIDLVNLIVDIGCVD